MSFYEQINEGRSFTGRTHSAKKPSIPSLDRELQFESMPGSHTFSALTRTLRSVDGSLRLPSARIRHIPQVLARHPFSPVGREVSRAGALNPKVEADPQVFRYELSAFSG